MLAPKSGRAGVRKLLEGAVSQQLQRLRRTVGIAFPSRDVLIPIPPPHLALPFLVMVSNLGMGLLDFSSIKPPKLFPAMLC